MKPLFSRRCLDEQALIFFPRSEAEASYLLSRLHAYGARWPGMPSSDITAVIVNRGLAVEKGVLQAATRGLDLKQYAVGDIRMLSPYMEGPDEAVVRRLQQLTQEARRRFARDTEDSGETASAAVIPWPERITLKFLEENRVTFFAANKMEAAYLRRWLHAVWRADADSWRAEPAVMDEDAILRRGLTVERRQICLADPRASQRILTVADVWSLPGMMPTRHGLVPRLEAEIKALEAAMQAPAPAAPAIKIVKRPPPL